MPVRATRQAELCTPARPCRYEVDETMGFLFLSYLATFLLVLKNKRKLAYMCFGLSTVLSLLMFWYHTPSSLELNF